METAKVDVEFMAVAVSEAKEGLLQEKSTQRRQ